MNLLKAQELNKIDKKYFIILQARLGSYRFSRKIMKKIDHRSILDFLIERLIRVFHKNNIILATTNKLEDRKLSYVQKKYGIHIFYGNEKNVLDRYIQAAEKFSAKKIIRLTSDCPLLDLKILKKMIKFFNNSKFDYISNNCILSDKRFPDGMDVEIFTLNSLKRSLLYCKNKTDYEHVTNALWKSKKFKIGFYKPKKNLSDLRFSVDYKQDLSILKKIIELLEKNNKKLCLKNYLEICKTNSLIKKLMKKNLDKFYINRPDLKN